MATIALSAGKLNMMPGLILDLKKVIYDYKTELFSLSQKTKAVDRSICDLEDVASEIKAATELMEGRVEKLEQFRSKVEDFIQDAVNTDQDAADAINQSKEDFYEEFDYLKPDAEKSRLERIWDNTCNWCKEHWKQILTTVVIVVGAVLAIAAVIATGGVALVPMLTGALTAIGVSSGAALTIATVASYAVAVVAVISTVGSSAMNIADTWGNIDNPTFNKWQKILNWTSTISNGLYSIGNMYNSIKGVSGKEFIARQKAIENGKAGYSNLDAKHPRMKHKSGADYDQTRKTEILNENRARNNGQIRSDKTGKLLEQPQKSARGVTPPKNEAQVDHIFPKASGGENSFQNAQVVERSANIAKTNNMAFSEQDYFLYSLADKGSVGKAIFDGFIGINNSVINTSQVVGGK